MNKPRIVVIGSSNTDMIVRLDRLPRPGETLLGGKFFTAAGGKGANQAVAAARAGGAVTLVAKVGRDLFGDQAVRGFEADGIDVSLVSRDAREPSGVALISVAAGGENSIAVASGANARLSPADIRRARPMIAGADVLLAQLETPLAGVNAAIQWAAAHGVRAILNPAPAQPLPDALLHRVSILTPNETEAELLTGVSITDDASAARAADRLRARGVGTVIITLGARGAWVANAAGQQRIAGFKVKPVDTTGAGDVFNGSLAVALGEGQPLLDAVRWAGAAAAVSVTKQGAQPSAPSRRAIEALLRRGSP
ncbi:ribokinase [Horticoccus luteus]|uniref:Ribokinase n=1 Tax=Horticoccus luteus TaxID=2862869 RepID=A0A8F9TTB2_9BACT|nr:ribokinase [Horticoccus luteus]QYM78854.1 ribokinase [Horticoccus luteus]